MGQIIKVIGVKNAFLVQNSQIIIGSIVNTALIVAAINLKGFKKILGVVTMPSIATIFSGIVFKYSSIYTIYMVPFIWLGNYSLIYLYKRLLVSMGKNYFIAGMVGIISKTLIIYCGFLLLNTAHLFPTKIASILQVAMGTTQIITATIGMLIAFVIYRKEIKH